MEISCQLFWNKQYKLLNNYVWGTHIAVELENSHSGRIGNVSTRTQLSKLSWSMSGSPRSKVRRIPSWKSYALESAFQFRQPKLDEFTELYRFTANHNHDGSWPKWSYHFRRCQDHQDQRWQAYPPKNHMPCIVLPNSSNQNGIRSQNCIDLQQNHNHDGSLVELSLSPCFHDLQNPSSPRHSV